MIIHNPILTGSFTVNGTDVSSITSSAASITAINSYTASQNILNGTYTLTSSFAAQTASFTAFTSSVNSFTASQLVLNGTYATTGSNTFAGIQTVNSNLIVTGSITAQTLIVQTITSSIDFVTGSTRFGSSLSTSTHQFTGSLSVTGSVTFANGLTVAGAVTVSNGTASTSTSTGALVVTGGVGIGGALFGTSATFSSTLGVTGALTGTTATFNTGTSVTPNFIIAGGGQSAGGGKGNIRSSDSGGGNYWDFGRDNLTTGDFVLTNLGSSPYFRVATLTGAATFTNNVTSAGYFIAPAAATSGGVSGFLNQYNAGNASSRSWRTTNDLVVYGDFAIQQSTTQTGSTYANQLYFNATGAATFSSSVTATTGTLSTTYNGGGIGMLHLTSDGTEGGTITFQKTSGTAQKYKFGLGVTSLFIYNETAGNQPFTLTSSGNVLIGTTTDYGYKLSVSGSNGMYITGGSSSAHTPFIVQSASGADFFKVRGDGYLQSVSTYNNTTASPNYLSISTSGFFERYVASSARYKEEIKDWNENGLAIILALKPKTYKYKKEYYNKADVDFLGLIAEEVAEVNTYLADYENEDGTGQVENVRYATIVVPLIKAIQEQQALITSLQAQITELKNK
jgi:hypothetical protein